MQVRNTAAEDVDVHQFRSGGSLERGAHAGDDRAERLGFLAVQGCDVADVPFRSSGCPCAAISVRIFVIRLLLRELEPEEGQEPGRGGRLAEEFDPRCR